MRKSWDSYFLDMAKTASERATCDRAKVGCVIVNNKRVISTGYNGSVQGTPHCDEVGHLLNDEGRCIRTIHAEQNALLQADRQYLMGATAYVTHEPCEICTKLLVQAGITRVVFLRRYENKYNSKFNHSMIWEYYGDVTD